MGNMGKTKAKRLLTLCDRPLTYLRKLQMKPVKLPNPKEKSKPYEQMLYPGQRVQVDVKHVPSVCIISKNDEKYYQYTTI